MKYYAMFYEVVDDFVAKRAPFREQHLRLVAEAHERGELVLAGALAEPADRTLLIFLVKDESQVVGFAERDPYVKNGLVKKYEIRPWTVVTENARKEAPRTPEKGSILRRWTARTTKAQIAELPGTFFEGGAATVAAFRGIPGRDVVCAADCDGCGDGGGDVLDVEGSDTPVCGAGFGSGSGVG